MTSHRSPIVTGLLAIALLTVAIPLAPAASAATCEGTPGDDIVNERGRIVLSHPATERNVRVTQALYLFLTPLAEDLARNVPRVDLQESSNGIDAYVVEFQQGGQRCQAGGTEDYCIEREQPDNGFEILFDQPDQSRPDIRVQFFDSGSPPAAIGVSRNPTVPGDTSGDAFCSDSGSVPQNAQFAVVYLTDDPTDGPDIPTDLVLDLSRPAPVTEIFRFRLVA